MSQSVIRGAQSSYIKLLKYSLSSQLVPPLRSVPYIDSISPLHSLHKAIRRFQKNVLIRGESNGRGGFEVCAELFSRMPGICFWGLPLP